MWPSSEVPATAIAPPASSRRPRSLIEVADVSYAKDRGLKWRRYASVGVGHYWIVNLKQKRIEVYSQPEGRGKAAGFKEVAFYGPDDEVPVILEGQERGRIAVRDVLP